MIAGSFIMMVMGVFGKFGAIFVSIPEPIVGGVFITVFGKFLYWNRLTAEMTSSNDF